MRAYNGRIRAAHKFENSFLRDSLLKCTHTLKLLGLKKAQTNPVSSAYCQEHKDYEKKITVYVAKKKLTSRTSKRKVI